MLSESLGQRYKPWLVACLVLLLGSLLVMAVAAGLAFVSYTDVAGPVWLVAVGVLAGLGVAGGFGGLLLLLATAGFRSFREGRKVQVLSPDGRKKM